MSFNISWIASADIPLVELESRMGLSRTGRTCPDLDFDFAGSSLKSGWNLVTTSRIDYVELIDKAVVAEAGNVVTLGIHEGIMISVAESWTNRHRDWHVLHDGQKDIEHLDVEGNLPEQLIAVVRQCEQSIRNYVPPPLPANSPEMPAAERAIFERMGMKVMPFGAVLRKVDFHFEIPIDLAEKLVGFRHSRPHKSLSFYELKPKAIS